MSAEFKAEAATFIAERLRTTEVYKFIQSLIRESIERIINPAAGKHVTSISDQVFIYHSMIYHYLATNGYPAAAEVMQGECYETFLSRSFLKENVVSYNDDVIEKSLSGHTLKNGVRIQRTIAPTIGVAASPKFSPKPDPAFEEVKDNLKKAIQDSADESVRRREEQIEMEEKSESEEEVVDEDEEESSSEAKSPQSSSSTVESEAEMVTSNWTRRLWGPNPQQLSTDTIIATPAPSRPSQLPPLVDVQHKPRITSIKSIDFDIPELEKSPSVQSVETPRAPLSPVQPAGTAPKQEAADQKASASQYLVCSVVLQRQAMRLQPIILAITSFLAVIVVASEDEERLMMDVFRGYNSLIQPVKNISDTPIIVKIALQLVLLINVDEKDQVMHTNVWLTLKWHDFQMRWNPVNYGEIKQIRVQPDKVWLPDIVLFNNADGNYEVSFMCNVVINYLGDMLWVPPAIYKSSCIIDVEFFPFDEQVCTLVFGSWTYNENEIKLEFEQAEWVDLSEYAASSIWDVMDAPASLVNKRSRIEFQVRIRRKTLFYTVVLIIPTVLMAFLSMAVFFLPTDSGEKMTLTISVLLSIVVFLLLVSKILPPTSSTIPLMAKYLLLTFVLNVITILVTVIIINVYFRGPTTHRMPKWVRKLFLEWMPKAMCMQRPKSQTRKYTVDPPQTGITQLPGLGQFTVNPSAHHPFCPSADEKTVSAKVLNCGMEFPPDPSLTSFYPLSVDALRAIDAIDYITDHLKQDEEYKMYRDDWKYVAMIIDRLLLYVFFGITVGGTCGILFSAPYVFQGVNQREVLDRLIELYKTGGSRD